MEDRKRKITIIVPCLNEAENIIELSDSIHKVIKGMEKYIWEFVFVDDGSADDTWKVVEELNRTDSRVKGVRLSRNFGKEVALTAGVESVHETDAIIFIDADLQHPPAVIPELIGQWEMGYQIVATQRIGIKYSQMRKLGSSLFYNLLKRFSDLNIEPMATDFRLLDREVLDVLKSFKERVRFVRGLIDWMGFRKTSVTFTAPKRVMGKSTFNLHNLTLLAINSFTSFSLLPLRITGWIGMFVLMITGPLFLYMILSHLILSYTMYTAQAYFVVFNTFLFGIVLAALGMIALYIGHIHTEVVQRPLYIVQGRVGFRDE